MTSQSTAEKPQGVTLPDRIVPMRVIVCGVRRTGTLSIRSALWQLGFYDCYHMHTMIKSPGDGTQWARAIEAKYAGKGTFTRADWDRLLGRYQAVCDDPASFFGAELAEVYPDAKVIVMNRDPEKWYESVLNSIYTLTQPQGVAHVLNLLYCLTFDPVVRHMKDYNVITQKHVIKFDHGKEKEKAIGWFNAQYKEYRDRIPEHRRIEYTIQEGWKPLCDFLEVPIPMVKDEATGEMVEAPFPRLNDVSMFQAQSNDMLAESTKRTNESLLNALGRLALTTVVGYAGYLAWSTRIGGRLPLIPSSWLA